MKYLLDTNACIRYLNTPDSLIAKRLKQEIPSDIAVCAIVKAELFYGALHCHDPIKVLAIQKKFVDQFISFPFDDRSAETYGKIRKFLSSQGTIIGPNDLLIAAIAIVNDVILITHNTREFSRVPDLRIEDWENS